MLRIEHVTKRYGKTLANKDITLSVDGGEIAVLMGPNGAGKSTLIKCITGLLRFQGTIEIDGFANKRMEAKRLLGYVPEMPAVYNLLTVSEHLEFIRRAYRLDDSAKAYGEALLERLEMEENQGKLGKELSKGMQQKLSLCCALLPRPKVIVFDEPLVGLDPHAIKELKAIFGELRGAGTTVLISTHMLDSVEGLWDTAHILMRGRIAAMKRNAGEGDQQELEKLFFSITEGREGS